MKEILQNINSPKDLEALNISQLEKLAQEIRELMIDVISSRGGHLASSLGVVELTIALHSVFDAPTDKIIWDVGHQSYAHKILTGRGEVFNTIRSYGGISGFPKREESLYDTFSVGHSSTSLSSALGTALARDLNGGSNKVVALIGDGALTGGMALEALNYAGEINTDLIVILNDNEMSIDQNVGGLSSYLVRVRTDPTYYRLKEDLEHILTRIPAIGKTMLRSAERLKDGLKYMLVPGILFEELGFTYLGPIDGHNIGKLQEILKKAKRLKGPVFIHTVTQKGKGYKHAELEPNRFHGVGPFSKDNGEPILHSSKDKNYNQVFGNTLVDLAHRDSSIVAITAAMARGTGLQHFSKQFPERFFDVGIAEQNAVTMAAGLANEGFKPVAAIYSTFLQRAYDQIVHDVCLQKLPVVFAVDRAGIVGEDGETHNGLFDVSYLRHMPEIVLMAPASGFELNKMLTASLTTFEKIPVAIRYPRGKAPDIDLLSTCETITPGRGKLLCQGEVLLILPLGSMVEPALKARKLLLEKGIKSSVINPRFVKPLDRDLICEEAKKCRNVLTVEENVKSGGFGSAILEMFEEEGINDLLKVKRLGVSTPFTGQGKREELLSFYGLTAHGIASEAEKLCYQKEKVQSNE